MPLQCVLATGAATQSVSQPSKKLPGAIQRYYLSLFTGWRISGDES